MDLSEKKLALFDAHLSHKGVQHLVDVATELLGNPLFMADMSMGIVCKSSKMGEGEQDFSAEDDPDRQSGLARQAADAGFMDWIYHHDQPVIGEFEGQPRYLSARVRDGALVLGHVVVVEIDRSFTPDDEDLLPIFCQTLSFELRRTRDESSSLESFGPLLIELMEGSTRGEEDVRRRLEDLGVTLPSSVRLLVFRPVDAGRMISPTYLRAQLDQAFRPSIGVVRDGECMQLIDGSIDVSKVRERLVRSVYTGGLAVGCSRPFRNVTMLDWAYRQADAALRFMRGTPNSKFALYDDVLCQHLIELVSSQDTRALEAFTLPELTRIEAFDTRDGTDYLHSLAVYLTCGRNVAKAARVLHVHKNSMYYRVQRIEELAALDLSDEKTCFLLQLSLAFRGIESYNYNLE